MKHAFFLLRLLAVPVVIVWINLVWLYDRAREHALRRRLGTAYEGPAEGEEDLR